MAEQTSEVGPDKAKKSGLMTLIKAIAFVSVIVLLQIAAASVLVPTAKETSEIANQLAATNTSHEIQNGDSSTSEELESESLASSDKSEVSLGSFDPETGASLNVDFDLFATVLADEESEFFALYESNSNRIR